MCEFICDMHTSQCVAENIKACWVGDVLERGGWAKWFSKSEMIFLRTDLSRNLRHTPKTVQGWCGLGQGRVGNKLETIFLRQDPCNAQPQTHICSPPNLRRSLARYQAIRLCKPIIKTQPALNIINACCIWGEKGVTVVLESINRLAHAQWSSCSGGFPYWTNSFAGGSQG